MSHDCHFIDMYTTYFLVIFRKKYLETGQKNARLIKLSYCFISIVFDSSFANKKKDGRHQKRYFRGYWYYLYIYICKVKWLFAGSQSFCNVQLFPLLSFLGELGQAVFLDLSLFSNEERRHYEKDQNKHGYNVFVSDLISFHRSLPHNTVYNG